MITKGQKVEFVCAKKEKICGRYDEDRLITGVVTYVNQPHKWFLVEYPGVDRKLRIGFKFCDIGQLVCVCGDDNAELATDEKNDYIVRRADLHTIHKKGIDKQMSITDYLAYKLQIMRELGVTPTQREWNHITSLDSESKIDAAVRRITRKRWAERSHK